MSSSPSRTGTGDGSSPGTGLGPRSTTTCEPLAFMPYRTLEKDGTVSEGFAQREVIDALHGPTGNKEPLICSQADHPARTSPSPANGQESEAPEGTCSGSSSVSQMPLFETEDGFSSRTCRVFSHRMGDGTFLPSSGRWPTSGFGTWPTEFWTPGSSEFPSGGGVCSSLPDVLQEGAPARFFLSPRAARGILRRAEKRGRGLPRALQAALTALASTHRDDGKKTT